MLMLFITLKSFSFHRGLYGTCCYVFCELECMVELVSRYPINKLQLCFSFGKLVKLTIQVYRPRLN